MGQSGGGRRNQVSCLSSDFPTLAFPSGASVSCRYGGNAKVVHFLGKTKPWSFTYDPKAKRIAGSVQEATTHPSFLLDWWSLFSSQVVPLLQDQYGDQPFHSGCVEVNDIITPSPLLLLSFISQDHRVTLCPCTTFSVDT